MFAAVSLAVLLAASLALGQPADARAAAGRGLLTAAPAAAAARTASRPAAATLPAARPTSTQQVVVTGSAHSPYATLDTYQYRDGGWQHVLSTPARVGYNGLSAQECEGCGYTPTGTFSVGATLYGVSASVPSSRYPYHHLTCGDWWNENSASAGYNTFVHLPCGASGPGGDSEALWTETVPYQHFAVINYNVDPRVPGRGSGIFLHDFTASGVTAGCVAVAPTALDTVLRWLDPAQHPVIRIGTAAEVGPPAPTYTAPPGNLYGIATAHTGSGRTEVHELTRSSDFRSFAAHDVTALGPTALSRWQFRLADYNGDGIPDLWAIDTDGHSGHTEVHILDGATGYRTFLLHAVTALPVTNLTDWTFGVGDDNGDDTPDLYAIDTHDPGSHATAVFVLNGRNLATFLLKAGTALAQTSLSDNQFLVADFDGDGRADVWDVKTQQTGSGRTEVHILDGADPARFLLHATTSLPPVALSGWTFTTGDANHDGRSDLYAINSHDVGTDATAVHVLNGRDLDQYLLHAGTALAPTALTGWSFAAA